MGNVTQLERYNWKIYSLAKKKSLVGLTSEEQANFIFYVFSDFPLRFKICGEQEMNFYNGLA